ncbi:trimethylamine N-oxide reductase system protein TorE [Vibrio sp. SM6]|uniref:Trimethylamine N-oxide reductase system protein TorE n=1 Tax=Vibrio agarilyticus TaxID=2726741 RepID=A0A7X8TSG1_9VIBR|nr:periplasmic nitrate reductase, NapE protein [Vibrio agarilyticus]NLS13423.1 trimethylamine N-oxide reductase system protein TorE [Vibrio agarilyticus]
MSKQPLTAEEKREKSDESLAFITIAVVLFPLLSVILIGGYGFIVWMLQLFVFGPPGHG